MNERDRTFPPPELHWSELKEVRKSPKHFRSAYEHPKKQSSDMLFGSLTHSVTLENGDPFVVYEGGRTGNAWKKFKEDNAGKMIVTEDEHAEALVIAHQLHADPNAAPLLRGLHEKRCSWTTMGRKCGGTIDVIGDGFIVDLKTTNYAEPAFFGRKALSMGYHAQLAWYLDGARSLGHLVNEAWIVAVETAPPYDIVVHHVKPRALEEGRKLIRLWMERVAQCEAVNEWPGYVQSPVDLDVVEDAGALLIDGEEVAA
jgi:hypothetical protein